MALTDSRLFQAKGCLMGASTKFDCSTAQGMVAGHAYSVMNVWNPAGRRLICLRNPHGSQSWTGPWGAMDNPEWYFPEAFHALSFVVFGGFWGFFGASMPAILLQRTAHCGQSQQRAQREPRMHKHTGTAHRHSTPSQAHRHSTPPRIRQAWYLPGC